MQGVMVRSRARWVEFGEKTNQYFCSMEKRNYQSKRMVTLMAKNDKEITDAKEILNEVERFYKNLYEEQQTEEIDTETAMLLETLPKLIEEDADSMIGDITKQELLEALKNTKNEKSPGTDGFTAEFIKFFWADIGDYIVKSINKGLQLGKLSISQREGLITLIPKGDKSRQHLRNWRPITLLNVIYKLASAAIANRIKKILPKLIHPDQCGFMSGRFIGDNIRLVYDVLQFANQQNQKGMLILIDFEKAFDTISWTFMHQCLRLFRFNESLINWVRIFMTDIKSCVQVNGQVSQFFNVKRGCRQGDPLSPYLFLLCSEILAHIIRVKKDIKGYKINNVEVKISLFADDTTLFLDGSKESFEKCIETLELFSRISGLKINAEKTKCIWFGTPRPPEQYTIENMNFEWNPENFTLLGVTFTTGLIKITENNIKKKMEIIKSELYQWSKRNLTPLGKITVIRSLMLAKLVHILTALPDPEITQIQTLQNMFYKFLWNNKTDKIKRQVAIQRLEDGGLNMPDIKSFITALKTSWIRRLNQSKASWRSVLESNHPNIKNILLYGPEFLPKLQNEIPNMFWKNVLQATYVHVKNNGVDTISKFTSISFVYNKDIQIGREMVTTKCLLDNKVTFIRQLKTENRYLSFREFQLKFEINNFNYLHYLSLITAIKKYEKKIYFRMLPFNNRGYQYYYTTIMITIKGCQNIYRHLIKNNAIPKGV